MSKNAQQHVAGRDQSKRKRDGNLAGMGKGACHRERLLEAHSLVLNK